jgi:hypothetical protein
MGSNDNKAKNPAAKNNGSAIAGFSIWRMLLPSMILAVVAIYMANQTKTQDLTPYGSVPPWPIFQASVTLSALCHRFADWLTPPAVRMFEISFSINKAVAVYGCTKLNWPDLMADGPKTCSDLATAADVSVPIARRLLRACVVSGMFREITAGREDLPDADRVYSNTPLGDVLRDGHPYSVKHFIGYHIEDAVTPILHILEGAKDETKLPFSIAHNLPHEGKAVWQYFAERPSQDLQFNKAMTALDGLASAALVHDFNWGAKCNTVVDIGGGRGSLLAAIMTHYSTLNGILFDQPMVVKQSRELWDAKYKALLGRAEIVGGSFFNAQDLPKSSGGYCYATKVIFLVLYFGLLAFCSMKTSPCFDILISSC